MANDNQVNWGWGADSGSQWLQSDPGTGLNWGLPINKVAGVNVGYCHPQYNSNRDKWEKISDVVQGQDQVKIKRTDYLPMIEVSKDRRENDARYKMYLGRAVFYNVVRRTLSGYVGEVFATDPVTTLPASMDNMAKDVDGGGTTLNQQARMTLARVVSLGRCGLYVDYPVKNESMTRADELNGKMRPRIYTTHPLNIINWRLELIDGRRLLTLVVIKESYVMEDDGFEEKRADQYRALRLRKVVEGRSSRLEYYIQIYRKTERQEWQQFGDDIIPLNATGKPFDEILFTFCGSDSNDPSVSDAPMYDMTEMNLAHYRNSADFEDSLWMIGNPTPWASGLTVEWVKNVLKGEITLGSRGFVMLPPNGQAGLLEVSETTIVFEAMKQKEIQLRALGAKLVDQVSTQKTATQDYREGKEDSSVLANCAVNVSSAYSKALTWAGQFSGVSDTQIDYTLNTDFSTARMTPEERKQLMAEWQGYGISWEEYRFRLRRAGIAYQDDDDAKTAIDKERLENENKDLAKQEKTMAITAKHSDAQTNEDN